MGDVIEQAAALINHAHEAAFIKGLRAVHNSQTLDDDFTVDAAMLLAKAGLLRSDAEQAVIDAALRWLTSSSGDTTELLNAVCAYASSGAARKEK